MQDFYKEVKFDLCNAINSILHEKGLSYHESHKLLGCSTNVLAAILNRNKTKYQTVSIDMMMQCLDKLGYRIKINLVVEKNDDSTNNDTILVKDTDLTNSSDLIDKDDNKECQHEWSIDESVMLTSNPPKYKRNCLKCFKVDYINV